MFATSNTHGKETAERAAAAAASSGERETLERRKRATRRSFGRAELACALAHSRGWRRRRRCAGVGARHPRFVSSLAERSVPACTVELIPPPLPAGSRQRLCFNCATCALDAPSLVAAATCSARWPSCRQRCHLNRNTLAAAAACFCTF